MEIIFKLLTIDMYDQLRDGWRMLPENSIGAGDDKGTIAQYLDRNEGLSFAAFDNNKLIGAILAGHDGRRAFLNHLFVLPDFQRQGVATKLVTLVFDQLRFEGLKRVGIFIHKSNYAAQNFWKSIGFEKVDFIETYGINIK
jgi:N-acetylglutamate synthase